MKPAAGCQSVYSKSGEKLFSGSWDPREIFDVISAGDPSFWNDKSVLEIAGNTGGLAVEIARHGADVLLTEPDPYENSIAHTLGIIEKIRDDEGLKLEYRKADFFDAMTLGPFNVVICLGLIYHFKYPQYLIDSLSSIGSDYLFISTQTHPSQELAMYNRQSEGILPERLRDPEGKITGWHPTRELFERMLAAGGFGEIVSLTDEPYDFPQVPKGLTNSSYYRARCLAPKDPEIEKRIYYPR